MAKRIVLRARNKQFVRQEGADGALRVPPENGPDTSELFTRTVKTQKTEKENSRITLQPANSTAANPLFVSAENGGGGLVLAKRSPAGSWETFEVVDMPNGKIALKTAGGQYLCADGRGGDLLLAIKTAAGEWESFELVDKGDNKIALKAVNGQYVRAEGGGGGRVVVNRDNRAAETFELDDTTYSGRVTLRAANRQYLCAEGGSGGPVLANRKDVGGDWEKFVPGTSFTLLAKPGDKWVQATNGGGAGLQATGEAPGDWETFVRTPWYDRPRPGKLLVYYAWPSVINGANGNVDTAGRTFSLYEYVILGEGIEAPGHGDNAKTKTIISNIRWNTAGATKVFGYIVLGYREVDRKKTWLTLDKIKERIGQWKDLGVDGIFFDEFGFDYQTGTQAEMRARQNDAVNLVHAAGLSVIANAWRPEDIWDTSDNLAASTMLPTDFYFSESYLIKAGDYQDATEWRNKAELVRRYQASYDFRVLSVATASGHKPDGTEIPGIAFDQAKFDYAWYGAMLYGHEAFGWGERRFSGSGADQNRAEYHQRRGDTPGYFTGEITGPSADGTYERPTDKGTVRFNPTKHTAGFG